MNFDRAQDDEELGAVGERERRLLRRYLLGAMAEDESGKLDERLFSGNELLQEVEVEQENLIEAYVRGDLGEEEAVQFEAQCSRSPQLQERVEEFRVLLAALQRKPEVKAAKANARIWDRVLLVLTPALAVAVCILAVVSVRQLRTIRGLNAQAESMPQQAAATPATVQAPGLAAGTPFVAFLTASVPRGEASLPHIAIPSSASLVELQVELKGAGDGLWNAELLEGNKVVWQSARVQPQHVGQEEFLALYLAASNLPPGSYSVQYGPSASPGLHTGQFVVTQ